MGSVDDSNEGVRRLAKLEEYRGERRTRREWAEHFKMHYRELMRALARGYSYAEIEARLHLTEDENAHRAQVAWTMEEYEQARSRIERGEDIAEIAWSLGRTRVAIRARFEEGKMTPNPKDPSRTRRRSLSVALTDEEHRRVRAAAKSAGKSISAFVRDALALAGALESSD